MRRSFPKAIVGSWPVEVLNRLDPYNYMKTHNLDGLSSLGMLD